MCCPSGHLPEVHDVLSKAISGEGLKFIVKTFKCGVVRSPTIIHIYLAEQIIFPNRSPVIKVSIFLGIK